MVSGIVTVLGVVAAAGWFVWLPQYRPDRHAGERYGIDVSSHQGRIDWKRVADDDISFAYIKATEGGDFVDRYFATNWTAAARARIERGAYHYFTLCAPGRAQAQNFLRTVPYDPNSLAPAVDLELAGNCRARPDRAIVVDQLDLFLTAVEAVTHRPTVLYLGPEFERRYRVRETLQRPVWELHFIFRSGSGWTIWQVDGLAHVDGVAGRVDLDVGVAAAIARSAGATDG